MGRFYAGIVATTLLAGTAAAQQTAPADPAAELRRGFEEVAGWVSRSADLVPADKYGYRPTEGVRTFGQLIAHIADSYVWYCAQASGQNVEWSDAIEKAGGDKAAIVQKLKDATTACNTAYAGSGRLRPLIGNIGHTNLHYGNIITYLRMMGMVPPSS